MKHLPLKTKLFAITLSAIVLMAVLMIGRSYQGITKLSNELSELTEKNLTTAVIERLEAETKSYGEQVSGYINSAFRLPLSLAAMLKQSIEDPQAHLSRLQVHELLGQTISANPDISALYAHFEPHGYDDLDAMQRYQDMPYSTESQGTLESYWIHNQQGQVETIKVDNPDEKYLSGKDEFGMREAEWYLCAKDSLKPCLLEPHFYEISETYKEMMTALIAPVVVNHQFKGIVGLDINLPLFQKLTEDLSHSLFNGQAKVTLISRGGLIVAASHFKDKLRRPLTEAYPQLGHQLQKLAAGESVLLTDSSMYVAAAIHIDTTNTNWSLLIELPKAVALAEIENQKAIAASQQNSVVGSLMLMGMILLGLTLLVMVVLIRSITQPLGTLNQQVEQLASAEGDLSQSLVLDTHAELITLGTNFNHFIQKLRELVNSLKGVSHEVRQASAENLGISEQTNTASEHQQNEVDNVVTATQEMSATAAEVARIAAEVSNSTNDIRSDIHASQHELSRAVDTSLELSENMQTASQSISQVAARSDDINRILTVIGGIAEQTNLLALNAAIEAARAGEQGRGFAVVADEVRTLASRTQASTTEINQLIASLQDEVKQAVTIIETGSQQSANAMNTTRHAHSTLQQVVEAINAIADNINQVATAAEEQSSVSEDITRNLTNIGDAAQMLATLAMQASSSSHQVTEQLDILDGQLNALRT